ncbi:MAG: protein of unknown function, putative Sensor histidine kinase, partial [Nitrospirae bacterium]|nr:protein of unknown function, putative Sensor histidine kinase [Nitrospirota bacterium]
PAGTIIKWNRIAEETTGYSHDELRGKHSLFFIAEEDRDAAQAGLEEAYSKGTSARELHVLTRDGKKVGHFFNVAALRDAGGRFAGYITSVSEKTFRNRRKGKKRSSRPGNSNHWLLLPVT